MCFPLEERDGVSQSQSLAVGCLFVEEVTLQVRQHPSVEGNSPEGKLRTISIQYNSWRMVH